MAITTTITLPKPTSVPLHNAGAHLEVDLGAITQNYNFLRSQLRNAECAPVLKADGYGLGADRVGAALWSVGARRFFVAHIDEGIRLRAALADAEIFILHGPMPGTEKTFREYGLFPVLCTVEQVVAWSKFAENSNYRKAALHVDTGMNRLGLNKRDVDEFILEPNLLGAIDILFTISHLACADIENHKMNREQLQAFDKLRKMLPSVSASLANSSGIFLGPDYHFDFVRPGVALTGVNPTPWTNNPMQPVVRLRGRILQCREIDSQEVVGYGADYRATGPRRIATIPVGYADGYFRCLGNRAFASINNQRVPVVGRVSMDLITLDVSEVPPEKCLPGDFVDLIGGDVDIDRLAEAAGTIAYEILTSLGQRYARTYVGGPDDGIC